MRRVVASSDSPIFSSGVLALGEKYRYRSRRTCCSCHRLVVKAACLACVELMLSNMRAGSGGGASTQAVNGSWKVKRASFYVRHLLSHALSFGVGKREETPEALLARKLAGEPRRRTGVGAYGRGQVRCAHGSEFRQDCPRVRALETIVTKTKQKHSTAAPMTLTKVLENGNDSPPWHVRAWQLPSSRSSCFPLGSDVWQTQRS